MDIADAQLEAQMMGYSKYKKRVFDSSYTKLVLRSIADHRDSIIKKYAGSTDKHMTNILGMCIADGIFAPVDFDGTIVDADDVFAAVYSYDIDFTIRKKATDKFVLWVLFTNDPYMPVLPMVYIQSLSFGEMLIHKKRNDFIPDIEKQCKNLKYPVCTLKEFEKIIQNEHTLRGSKMDKEFLLQQVFDAMNRKNLFEPMSISYELGGMSRALLTENGYTI